MIKERQSFVIVLIIIALIALGGIFYFLNSTQESENERMPDLQITTGHLIDSQLNTLSDGVLTDITFIPEGSIVHRYRNHQVNVSATIVMPPNEIGNVLIYENEDGSLQLDDPISVKDAVSVSQDGLFLAYAELNLPFGSTLYSNAISDWNVVVYEIATGNTTVVGTGFAPYFLPGDSTVVAFTGPDGFTGYDIATGELFTSPVDSVVENTVRAAHVSPNGSYVALYNSTTNVYDLFSIIDVASLELSGAGAFPELTEAFALTDEYAYGVVRNQETNERTLWRYLLEDLTIPHIAEGEILHTFKEDQIPYRIIP